MALPHRYGGLLKNRCTGKYQSKGFCTTLLFNYQRTIFLFQAYVLIYTFKENLKSINQLVTVCPLASDICLLKMVEVNGIEPMTSCVQGRRSPN